MISIKALKREQSELLILLNKGRDAKFLEQWSGRKYTYPITIEQVVRRIESEEQYVFGIYENEQLIGSVELEQIDMEKKTAVIGGFILQEDTRGKGIGKEVIRQLITNGKKSFGVNTFKIMVFDYNKVAQRCYMGAGFIKTKEITINENESVYEMKYTI